jgi:hypothetical protein
MVVGLLSVGDSELIGLLAFALRIPVRDLGVALAAELRRLSPDLARRARHRPCP